MTWKRSGMKRSRLEAPGFLLMISKSDLGGGFMFFLFASRKLGKMNPF